MKKIEIKAFISADHPGIHPRRIRNGRDPSGQIERCQGAMTALGWLTTGSCAACQGNI